MTGGSNKSILKTRRTCYAFKSSLTTTRVNVSNNLLIINNREAKAVEGVRCYKGSISNIQVSGSVVADTCTNVGGIVGYNSIVSALQYGYSFGEIYTSIRRKGIPDSFGNVNKEIFPCLLV